MSRVLEHEVLAYNKANKKSFIASRLYSIKATTTKKPGFFIFLIYHPSGLFLDLSFFKSVDLVFVIVRMSKVCSTVH